MDIENFVGIVGVGQCGGNIANYASKRGIPVAVINTSEKDMKPLDNVQKKLKVGIPDGSAKDRANAVKGAVDNYEEIVKFIKASFSEDVKIIYLAFSAGGGAGSGMSPVILEMLQSMSPEREYGAICVLPRDDEIIAPQVNAYNCIEELFALNKKIPIMFFENQKLAGEAFPVIFEKINNSIISALVNIVSARKESEQGNMDTMEKVRLMTTPGTMLITKTYINHNEDIIEKMKKSMKNHFLVEPEFDGVIIRAGHIYEVPASMTKGIHYEKLYEDIGTPYDTFEGYNIIGSKEQPSVVSIYAGMSKPHKKISHIENLLEKVGHHIKIKEEVENEIKEKAFDMSRFNAMLKNDARMGNKKEVEKIKEEIPEKKAFNPNDLFKRFGK